MKRLLAALIFVSVFLHSLAPFSFAQTQATESALPSRVESDVPNDYSTHTQMLIIELLAAISCQLSGVDPVNPSGKCLGVNPETGKIGFMENGGGGAIAVVTKMMIFTFDIPISTHDYTSYTASNFGIVKSSFAQNVSAGFNGLSPLLPVWVAFRNVIYVLFVIAFMVVGMGIMFRRNFDPKTVMTIQSSIPRVIIILILVTFSFAISGFLIDMMYLVMYLLYGIITSIDGVSIPTLSPSSLAGSTAFGATGSFGGGIPGIAYDASRGLGSQISAIFDNGVGNAVGGIITGVMALPLLLIPGVNLAYGVGIGLGALGIGGGIGFGGIGNEVLGLVGGIIAFLIIVIAVLSALFRLWIALIKSYLFILIDVAIAPIWIAGSLIPGSPWTMGSWFRHILKYILVFPLTFAMFLLGSTIIQLFNQIPDNASIFAPPFIGNSLNPKHLGSLLGLGLILMLPEVINMVQAIIKAPENKFQQAIPQGFGIATGVMRKAGSPVKKKLWSTDEHGRPTGTLNFALKQKINESKDTSRLANIIDRFTSKRTYEELINERQNSTWRRQTPAWVTIDNDVTNAQNILNTATPNTPEYNEANERLTDMTEIQNLYRQLHATFNVQPQDMDLSQANDIVEEAERRVTTASQENNIQQTAASAKRLQYAMAVLNHVRQQRRYIAATRARTA